MLTFHTVTECNSHQSGQITGLHVLENRRFKSSPPQPLTSSNHNVIGLSQLATGLIHFLVGRPFWLVGQRGSTVLGQFPVLAEGPAHKSPHCTPLGLPGTAGPWDTVMGGGELKG